MRTAVLASIAGVLAMSSVAATGIWWHDHAASAPPTADFSSPRLPLRTLAPIERAQDDQLQRQLTKLTDGNVVLDMRALESLDAAVTHVEHWRNKHPAEAHLVCWLAAADDQELVKAVRSLSESGCSALRVALIKMTESTD